MPQQIEVPGMGIVEFPDGMSDADMSAAIQRSKSSIPGDMAKSLGTGLAEAGIGVAGLPGDVLRVGDAAVRAMARPQQAAPTATPKAGGLPPNDEWSVPGSHDIKNYIEGRFGKLYQPQTVPGEYMRTFGQMAPAALLPGGVAMRAANVALPAIASETAGQLTRGQPYEPFARIAGALAGAPSVGGRAITPLPASPERRRLVNILRNEGVTSLTAGQKTGSNPLQWFEQAMTDLPLAGGGARRITHAGKEQFTAASLRRVGETGTRADDIALDNALTRMGQQFDALASRNTARADPQLITDMQQTVGGYFNLVGRPNRVPAVENYAREIIGSIQKNGGSLPGEVYQSLRSRMDATSRNTSNPEAKMAIRELKEAVDSMMERTLQATGNTADLQAWREVRRQYRNFITLERAATGAGAEVAEGLVSPSQLRSAVVNQDRRAYARGDGDFAELARAGEAIMRPLPQSGTAPRSFVQNATAGGLSFAMLGTPILAGRAVANPAVQAFLSNQVLSGVLHGTKPKRDALVQALLAEQPRLQLQSPR